MYALYMYKGESLYNRGRLLMQSHSYAVVNQICLTRK